MREQVSRRALDGGDGACCGPDLAGQRFERAVNRIQNSVEPDPHLQRERPARIVIRRGWRRTRIGEIVRMILRLEHVENLRAKRLRGLHDERTCRVCPPAGAKLRRRPMHRHAVPYQRIHELRGCKKVWLAGRNDVAAGIAALRPPDRVH